MSLRLSQIQDLLGAEAQDLLSYQARFSKEGLYLPSPDFIDRVYTQSDRPHRVLGSLAKLFGQGRLASTGYLSILPVDQGIEHAAGASFASNPIYFDPEKIVELALEGGCNAVASTFGVLGSVARKYAHKIPFVVKINHNQLLTYPNKHDQVLFGTVERAFDMGAVAIGATIYFGSPESDRQIIEIAKAFDRAHELGMATILWCYTRSDGFKAGGVDYHTSADLSGQANHLGVTIRADIIKQKMATNNGGYKAVKHADGSKYGRTDERVYSELSSEHEIDLVRYQVINCYMGRAGLISSGGASSGQDDLQEAVRTAVINKRAGGTGLILGRKAFQRPFAEGVKLLHAVQDVYLCEGVTVASSRQRLWRVALGSSFTSYQTKRSSEGST